MKPEFVYYFDWDPLKAAVNYRKHGVNFTSALTVFDDPRARTQYDGEHGADEERWITIGQTAEKALLVVVHTFEEWAQNAARIRLISVRTPTPRERMGYEMGDNLIQEPAIMQDEYDFTGAERGKFFREGVAIKAPVHIDLEVLSYFMRLAGKNGVEANELINDALRREMARAAVTSPRVQVR